MIEFYYAQGACSLASQIALAEAGADYAPHRLNLANGDQRTPAYLAINPHGRVPALVADGHVVTEGPAILGYIAERFPEAALLPSTPEARAHVRQLLNWYSASVHATFAHIFRPERFGPPDAADAIKATARAALAPIFDEIEAMFTASEWAALDGYSIADGYPFVFYRWGLKQGFDMRTHAAWTRHTWRMLDRPATIRALATEDLPRSDWIGVTG